MNVGVVIPTRNRAALVSRAIQSVVDQSYTDWELIVIDDGGDDETEDIVQEIRRNVRGDTKNRIHYRHTTHRGVSAARNLGADMCDSPYLAFLDSDDVWHPDKLQIQLEELARHPDCPLIYSAEVWMRGGKRVNPPQHYRGASGRVLDRSIRACIIGPSTVVFRRGIYEQFNGFDETYPVCEDYDLWLRLCSVYEVCFVEQPLVTRHGGRADQLSVRTTAMDYWRVRALADLCGSKNLTASESELLKGEIVRRGKVLLTGYIRRNKRRDFEDVKGLVKRAVPEFQFRWSTGV